MCFFGHVPRKMLVDVKGPDGRKYKVRASPRQSESAAALARLNARVTLLIERLVKETDAKETDAKKTDVKETDQAPKMKGVVERIVRRYNPDVISEGVIDNEKTSYTVNKGEEVVYCLRSRDERDQLYSDNKLMHVAIHELAHIGSLASGDASHAGDFPANLHYLERKAAEFGLITPISENWEYCGLWV